LTVPSGGPKPTPLVDEAKTLAAYGVADNAELRLKDLGLQVPYRMLYLFEYVSATGLGKAYCRDVAGVYDLGAGISRKRI
jgi:hypothetical protein